MVLVRFTTRVHAEILSNQIALVNLFQNVWYYSNESEVVKFFRSSSGLMTYLVVPVQCGQKNQFLIRFWSVDALPKGLFCIDFVNKILRFWDRLVLVCQYVQSVLKVILGKSSFPTSGVIKFLLTPIGEIRLTSNSYDY